MNDTLRQWAHERRTEFDDALPPDAAWTALGRALDRLPHADALERTLLLERPLLDAAEPAPAVWSRLEQVLDALENDPLEGFVRLHREALDVGEPDLRVWSAIGNNLETAPPLARGFGKLYRIAAAIALLCAAVGLGVWYGQNNPAGDPTGMRLADVSDEYAELERYYEGDIAVKQQKLVGLTENQTDTDVLADLEQIDRVMLELRSELANVPPGNREQVVRAMIDNYKAKAAILERVLERLEKAQHPDAERQPSVENL